MMPVIHIMTSNGVFLWTSSDEHYLSRWYSSLLHASSSLPQEYFFLFFSFPFFYSYYFLLNDPSHCCFFFLFFFPEWEEDRNQLENYPVT